MALNFQYEPTELEDELFLSEVPEDLLEQSIETQFKDPLEYRKKDYVQTFLTRYLFTKDNTLDEDMETLGLQRDKFIAFMLNIFREKLSLGFPNFDDLSEDDQHEMIHLTYRFFIKNIKKNFVTVIINYIEKFRETIFLKYEKKKDITSSSFQSEIEDEYDIYVLTNLGRLIQDILEDIKNEDIDFFLDLCVGDEPSLELEFVREKFDDFSLTGNFIEPYVEMIDEGFLVEIQSKVRNKILRKYPYRSRKDVPEEEADDNNE